MLVSLEDSHNKIFKAEVTEVFEKHGYCFVNKQVKLFRRIDQAFDRVNTSKILQVSVTFHPKRLNEKKNKQKKTPLLHAKQ